MRIKNYDEIPFPDPRSPEQIRHDFKLFKRYAKGEIDLSHYYAEFEQSCMVKPEMILNCRNCGTRDHVELSFNAYEYSGSFYTMRCLSCNGENIYAQSIEDVMMSWGRE